MLVHRESCFCKTLQQHVARASLAGPAGVFLRVEGNLTVLRRGCILWVFTEPLWLPEGVGYRLGFEPDIHDQEKRRQIVV